MKPACHRLWTARRRFIVFVVNSLSSPPTDWDRSEDPPGTVDVLLKASGTPIDAFSFEAVELLRDTAARWQTLRRVRDSAAMAANKDPAVAAALRVPDAEIFAIDVSFPALKDKAELAFLNEQPTSFVLSDEAVDRLRAAAGTIIWTRPNSSGCSRISGRRSSPSHQRRNRRIRRNRNRHRSRSQWTDCKTARAKATRSLYLEPP